MENFTVKTVAFGNKSGDDIVREIYISDKLVAQVLIGGYLNDIWAVDVNLWSGDNANDERCYFYPDKNKLEEQQIEDCVIGIQKQITENIVNDVYTERERNRKAFFDKINRPEPLKEQNINYDALKVACAEYLSFIDNGEKEGTMRHDVERQKRYSVFLIAMHIIYGDSIERYRNKQGYYF